MRLFSIKSNTKYFVIKEENEIVVKAPKEESWAIGKKIENVVDHYKQNGCQITII